MRHSFKQQQLQKSNNLLLHNSLQDSTNMIRTELSDELNVGVVNNRIDVKHALNRIKR